LLLGVGVIQQAAEAERQGEASESSPALAAKERAAVMMHEQKMIR
jgi:hypothetical protein